MTNEKETIEEKTFRITCSVWNIDPGEGVLYKAGDGKAGNVFKNHCKMIAVAIAEEREACAKICDDKHFNWSYGSPEEEGSASGPKECATLIRQRDTTGCESENI